MAERVIAIGDVHGCSDALRVLIELIKPTRSDTVVFLGDCIDRGPDSRAVIDQVRALEDACNVVPILGNHEEMLLLAADRPSTALPWLGYGGRETLASYGVSSASEVPPEHLAYIRSWGDYWETATHFFAHGSYDPALPLDRQPWSDKRWESLRDRLPAPHSSGKTAVLGHTSQKTGEVLDAGHLLCIDTFCCGGQWLTAFDAANRKYWQVDPAGRVRTP